MFPTTTEMESEIPLDKQIWTNKLQKQGGKKENLQKKDVRGISTKRSVWSLFKQINYKNSETIREI